MAVGLPSKLRLAGSPIFLNLNPVGFYKVLRVVSRVLRVAYWIFLGRFVESLIDGAVEA